MSDWIEFEVRIEPIEWGKYVYTVLRLPAEVSKALAARGAKRAETRQKRIEALIGIVREGST